MITRWLLAKYIEAARMGGRLLAWGGELGRRRRRVAGGRWGARDYVHCDSRFSTRRRRTAAPRRTR